jgi:uncharacterized membrane protein YkoI
MKRGLFISLAALASIASAPALAAPQPVLLDRAPAVVTVPSIEPTLPRYAQRQISPSESKAIALRRVSGKVVDIRRMRDAYRVRIIRSDGRVVDIVVDANTGRIR